MINVCTFDDMNPSICRVICTCKATCLHIKIMARTWRTVWIIILYASFPLSHSSLIVVVEMESQRQWGL